jgi:hypothetical protein
MTTPINKELRMQILQAWANSNITIKLSPNQPWSLDLFNRSTVRIAFSTECTMEDGTTKMVAQEPEEYTINELESVGIKWQATLANGSPVPYLSGGYFDDKMREMLAEGRITPPSPPSYKTANEDMPLETYSSYMAKIAALSRCQRRRLRAKAKKDLN